MSEQKDEKCTKNCNTCQFHNDDDSCSVTGEKDCSKKTNFAECNDYLISEKLIHF